MKVTNKKMNWINTFGVLMLLNVDREILFQLIMSIVLRAPKFTKHAYTKQKKECHNFPNSYIALSLYLFSTSFFVLFGVICIEWKANNYSMFVFQFNYSRIPICLDKTCNFTEYMFQHLWARHYSVRQLSADCCLVIQKQHIRQL